MHGDNHANSVGGGGDKAVPTGWNDYDLLNLARFASLLIDLGPKYSTIPIRVNEYEATA